MADRERGGGGGEGNGGGGRGEESSHGGRASAIPLDADSAGAERRACSWAATGVGQGEGKSRAGKSRAGKSRAGTSRPRPVLTRARRRRRMSDAGLEIAEHTPSDGVDIEIAIALSRGVERWPRVCAEIKASALAAAPQRQRATCPYLMHILAAQLEQRLPSAIVPSQLASRLFTDGAKTKATVRRGGRLLASSPAAPQLSRPRPLAAARPSCA
eukprot:scaffold15385_cov96-Isochrysis_galbana.AAC.3